MLRRLLPNVFSALMVITALPRLASADDVCISPLTVDAVSDCPDVEARPILTHRSPVKLTTVARKATERSLVEPPPPSAAATGAEIRRNLSRARSTHLLVTEI